MAVITDQKRIDEVLTRGIGEIIELEHLRKRMLVGEKLRIKFGIDPTSPHMHLGHTVPLRKLRQFQDLGHQAVLIIGDATAMIGDPTGRSEERNKLSEKEIKTNQKTYLKQAGKILNLKKLEVHHNGEWFHKMPAQEFLSICSLVTVAQVLQREDFKRRLNDEEHPLSALEMTYPVMQGYDSVMIKADVEIGGADQLLNLLMGRRLQRRFKQSEQDVFTVPLIEGTDGVRKMSKSFGNAITLESEPEEKFGAVMTVPDSMIVKYFTLLTSKTMDEITAYEKRLKSGENPRDVKMELASTITEEFHGKKAAEKARQHFESVFQKHEMPEEMPTVTVGEAQMNIVDLLVHAKLAESKSDARRVVEQGGVKVGDRVITSPQESVSIPKEGIVLQRGKRQFVRIRTK